MRRRAVLLLTTAMTAALVAGLLVSSLASAQIPPGVTFEVTKTDNSGDGSLRKAIGDANDNDNDAAQDIINFNIPDTDPGCNATTKVCIISPTSSLHQITEPVLIDGYTQGTAIENTKVQGTNAILLVELDGAGAGTFAFGLDIGDTSNVVIRGLAINNFSTSGIRVDGGTGHRIEGNFIGTEPDGFTARPNGSSGIAISSGSGTTIGGTLPAARNLISGNNVTGISFNPGPSDIEIQGNLIGTQRDGSSDLGNSGFGVIIRSFPDDRYTVGGTDAGAGNTIAFNDQDGVLVISGAGHSILSNSIFENGELGIDLQGGTQDANGVTENDLPKDKDEGENNLQNFPELSTATLLSGGQITIEGTLNSRPKKNFTIQFFSSPREDPSNFGEGKTFIGQTTLKTNRKGKRSIDFTFTPAQAVSPGEKITATATNDKTSDTSEFSQAITVG